jgi:glycosyltransferase involved in cell wall biosynthesis
MNTVSVVIPMLNAATMLRACLDALEGQELERERFEIILVDNGSQDGSAEIAREYPGVRLLFEPRPGAYVARNRAIAESTGQVIAFLDPDCVPVRTWLRDLLSGLSEPDVGVVLGKVAPGSDGRILQLIAAYEHAKEAYCMSRSAPDLYFGHTNNMAVWRTVFHEVGPFLEFKRGPDSVFVQQVVERYGPGAVQFCSTAEVTHLEVTRPSHYFGKMYHYGKSLENMREWSPTRRPLSLRERLRVFHQALAERRLGQGAAVLLLGALAVGAAHFEAGRKVAQLGAWFGKQGRGSVRGG